jgi:hypothetical protein
MAAVVGQRLVEMPIGLEEQASSGTTPPQQRAGDVPVLTGEQELAAMARRLWRQFPIQVRAVAAGQVTLLNLRPVAAVAVDDSSS